MSGATLAMGAAAELMGLSRWQARKRLIKINRQHPQLRLLQRAAYDGTAGNYQVLASALRRILLDEDAISLQEVDSRVGFAESDIRGLQARVGRLENKRI